MLPERLTTSRKLALALFVLLIIVVLASQRGEARAQSVADYCTGWGSSYQSGRIVQWLDMWHPRNLSEAQLASVAAVNAADSFWRGYNSARPFDIPDDVETVYKLTLTTENGKRHLYVASSASTPETVYLFAFMSLRASTDANGNYYGVHPCRVFSLPTDAIADWWE